jgi:predicted outer membrane repeat protein
MGVMALKTMITGGNFQKSGIFFILIILLLFAVSMATLNTSHAAATLYVNGTGGNDTYDGTSPTWVSGTIGPKKTIQNASNAVDTSGTVHVASGTYNEHISIFKSLNLIGANRDTTIINGTNNGQPLMIADAINVNIKNFTIRNGASTNGGAINNRGTVTITNSTLTGNTATNGGAIYNFFDNTLTIINSTITGNTASNFGGAIYNGEYCTSTITNSTLTGNTATNDGGSIYNDGTVTITNSTITGNTANGGGAILNDYGTVNINNSTITGNTATSDGGAIYTIYGTINMHFNRVVSNTLNTIVTINSVINAEDNWWGSNSNPASQFSGTGTFNYSPWIYMTLNANPTLVLNGGTSTLNASFNNAYDGAIITPINPASGHLPDGSVVTFTTDRGNVGSKTTTKNTSNGAAIATLTANEGTGTSHLSAQLDSQTVNTAVGVETLYVNGATGNDTWDGTNPTFISGTTGPMKTIQTAVNTINSGGTVNVARGIYTEHLNVNKNLNLIGANRDTTIIDGTNNGQPLYVETSNVNITNFTIRNGTSTVGGGIENYNGYLTITNCFITGNTATHLGGAIYNLYILNITNSTITENTATNEGGAIYNAGTLTITNSTITENTATNGGGIMNDATATITNSTITENTATNEGGAIYKSDTLTITNSTITGNTAPYGGAIYNSGGTLTITNSTITENTANYGSAIYNAGTLSPTYLTLTNSALTGNTANNDGGAIYTVYSTTNIDNSTLTGNSASGGGGGAILNYYGTLTLTNSVLTENTANYGSAISNFGAGVTMHFNRVVSNSPNVIYTYSDVIDAENNWWGSNMNPSSQFTGSGTVNYSPWLYMTLTANPTLILNGATSTLTASFNNAYNGAILTPINPVSGHLPDGSLVTFTTDLGSVGSPTTTKNTSNGAAIATLTANAGIGTANITAQLDSQTLTTTVGITDTLYVNGATGNDDFNGLSPTYISGHNGPMATIKNALSTIILGGTIKVASGTYTEDLIINQNVNIIGTIKSIITPPNPTDCIITITDLVTNAMINGFTIQGATSGTGVFIMGSGVTIKNNSIVGNKKGILTDNVANIVITENNIMDNQVGIDRCSDGIKINFNRILNNEIGISTKLEGIDATNNWWGSNDDPSSRVSSGVVIKPWLVLNVTANPTVIKNGGTSNITADLLHDSKGEYHPPANGHVPDMIPVSFTTTKGTINSPLSTINGTAKANLVGGAVSGVADVSATVDSQTVHTSVTIDNTAPTVTSTNPAQYAVNLPSNQVFTVTFSEAIKAANLNLVVLKTSTGTVIATTKSITGNVLTITPNSALGEAKYLLLLYAGCVTDLAGNPAAALSRTYGVGAQPYVTSTDPANYATNVPRNKVITATFNEPIVAKYLTLIYLKTVTGGIQIATTKSVSGNTLTITPTTPLAANTRYMVLIYTFAVTDLAGNSNVNKQFTFTTGTT